jgi:hypothetical protein
MTACNQSEPFGEVTIQLVDGSKSISPTESQLTVSSIRIWGTCENGSTIASQIFTLGSSITIQGLSIGTWSISIEGLNAEGTVITEVAVDSSVEILSGKKTTATFSLTYLATGNGTLSLAASWPGAFTSLTSARMVLSQPGVTENYTYTADSVLSEGVYSASITNKSLVIGDYDVALYLVNASGAEISFPMIDMVDIFDSIAVEGTIALVAEDFQQVASPVITVSDSTDGKSVTITSTTSGSQIYYSTDGVAPTGREEEEKYTGPFTLTDTGTVLAIATADGFVDSEVSNSVISLNKAETPTISLSEGDVQTVSLSCSTSGSTIYYRYATGGSSPTSSYTAGSSFSVTEGTSLSVEAYAVATGYIQSSTASESYAVASSPVFSQSSGTFSNTFNLTLSGNTVRYKVDSGSYATYSSTIPITSTGTVITAFNRESGKINSSTVSNTYSLKVATPSYSTSNSGSSKVITLSCATSSSSIYYTTDGTTPTTSSSRYYSSFTVSSDCTINVIGTKSNFDTSSVRTLSVSFSTVATPTISLSEGDNQTVSFSCSTSGSTIYYRYAIGGSSPTSSYTTGSSFSVTEGSYLSVEAYAAQSGYLTSSTASESFEVVQSPVFSQSSGTFSNTFNLTLSGNTVRYKVDSGSYATYSSTIPITSTGTVITAFNRESGKINSSPLSQTYTLQVATPTLATVGVEGGMQVTLACVTSGATIYCSTDGSDPSVSGVPYTGPFTVTSTSTVKAYAIRDSFLDSDIASSSVSVSQVATPSISTTNVELGKTVTLSCATSSSSIYYTTDGTTPTTSSSLYSIPFTLTSTSTVKAMATKIASLNSAIASSVVTISTAATPTMSLSVGDSQTLTYSCSTSGASIHYKHSYDGGYKEGTCVSGTAFEVFEGASLEVVYAYASADGYMDSVNTGSIYQCATAPSFDYASGMYTDPFAASITGTYVWYKLGSGSFQLYSSAISIPNAGTTITAYRRESGKVNSPSVSNYYSLQVATPQMSLSHGDNQTMTLSCSTTGSEIYYKYGSDDEYTYYSAPFAVTPGVSMELEVMASASDMFDSVTTGGTFQVSSNPVFSSDSGTYPDPLTITLSGYNVWYKIDSGSYQQYTEAIAIADSGTTVTAFSSRSGDYINSGYLSKTYSLQVATPSITTTNVSGGKNVSIASDTKYASYYYTTDGSTPTSASTKYSVPFKVSSSLQVKAIGIRTGYGNSEIASLTISVSQVATPTISLSIGESQVLIYSCSTSGATIDYNYEQSSGETRGEGVSGTSIAVDPLISIRAQASASVSGMANSDYVTVDYPVAPVPVFSQESHYGEEYVLISGTNVFCKIADGSYQACTGTLKMTPVYGDASSDIRTGTVVTSGSTTLATVTGSVLITAVNTGSTLVTSSPVSYTYYP